MAEAGLTDYTALGTDADEASKAGDTVRTFRQMPAFPTLLSIDAMS